ncbi:MAG TPA: PEP-CTERM sorting domain-containing protein [Bryobacteraceae bacterium]|nr:PEP-CTERM sorting domain-containing protein [Bryobacteraceae bacterium]
MMINRNALAASVAALISVFATSTVCADSLQFGVVGSPIDLSANISESILPNGGTVFQDSKPIFGTVPNPKQSAELLHISSTGINPSPRSNISGAFASSLAESNGNGGVGVSQLIFGSPGGSGENVVRQMAAQSLWTQTFRYNGTPTVDLKLHLQIPALQVELWGVPPFRDNPSFTETAEARANVDTVITHADGTFSKGGSFEFGLREFETQLPSTFVGSGLENFADMELIGTDGLLFQSLHEDTDFPEDRVRWRIDSVSTDVDLGLLHTGDTLAYVYTLTAEGTTHGFEQGYDAFLGDPFGVDVVTNNLNVTAELADTDAPEANTYTLMLLGLAALFVWRRRTVRSRVH